MLAYLRFPVQVATLALISKQLSPAFLSSIVYPASLLPWWRGHSFVLNCFWKSLLLFLSWEIFKSSKMEPGTYLVTVVWVKHWQIRDRKWNYSRVRSALISPGLVPVSRAPAWNTVTKISGHGKSRPLYQLTNPSCHLKMTLFLTDPCVLLVSTSNWSQSPEKCDKVTKKWG